MTICKMCRIHAYWFIIENHSALRYSIFLFHLKGCHITSLIVNYFWLLFVYTRNVYFVPESTWSSIPTRIITLTVRLYLYSNVLFHTKKPNMYLEIDHISSICSTCIRQTFETYKRNSKVVRKLTTLNRF